MVLAPVELSHGVIARRSPNCATDKGQQDFRFVTLIYIAITALSRVLIELVGAEHHTGTDVVIVAGAILGLSFAVLVLRFAAETSNGLDVGLESVKGEE
jgi:hypothetical protein